MSVGTSVVRAGVRIRAVGERDLHALIALWHEVFPEYRDPAKPQRDPRANIERKLAQRDGLFWLAEDEQGVLGTAMAGYDGHRGWLYSVGVHTRARRGGVARALVAHAEEVLRARGCPKINLQVMAVNDEAQAFWRALGYVPDAVVSLGKRLV
jgi:ribosomal protein S18 acetylase RimI-like enzyme